jgi:hypothetical protein
MSPAISGSADRTAAAKRGGRALQAELLQVLENAGMEPAKLLEVAELLDRVDAHEVPGLVRRSQLYIKERSTGLQCEKALTAVYMCIKVYAGSD